MRVELRVEMRGQVIQPFFILQARPHGNLRFGCSLVDPMDQTCIPDDLGPQPHCWIGVRCGVGHEQVFANQQVQVGVVSENGK